MITKKIFRCGLLLATHILLFLLVGCSREKAVMEIPTNDRMVRIQGAIEGAESTRISFVPKEGTLDYITTFTSGDNIVIAIRQGNLLVRVNDYEPNYEIRISQVGANGQTCSFEFKIPDEIDISKPMDVIGITCPSQDAIVYQNQFIYTTRRTTDHFGPDRVYWDVSTMPISFIVRDYTYTENLFLKVRFNHIGAYLVWHVTNNFSRALYPSLYLATTPYERKTPWV